MQAVVCRSYGPPENLTLEEVTDPRPGQGQVLIDVHSAGLNFPDTLQIAGKYQYQPPFPFTPGIEVAGRVAVVGEGVSSVAAGDRVLALPGVGGMAERVVADAVTVARIPAEMDFDTAAGFGLAYGTSYHALKQRGRLQSGETLLVLGAGGGVGLAAVEIGKALGARVIAAASSAEKLNVAGERGADALINYSEESLKDRIKELTAGRGADVIYDPVGGDLFDQCTRAIGWKGRLLVVGFASGVIPKYPTNLALLKGCDVVGVFWGEFCKREPEQFRVNTVALLDLFDAGKLRPHVDRVFPLTQFADAFNVLMNRQAIGKIVLRVRN